MSKAKIKGGRKLAIDYQPKRDTRVVDLTGPRRIETILSYPSRERGGFDPKKVEEAWKQRVKFIESLTAGDAVYLQAGGGGDMFARACHLQGAQVFRLPTWKIKEQREKDKQNKSEAAAPLLADFASQRPDEFYQFKDVDVPIVTAGAYVAAMLMIQNKIRKPAVSRLRSVLADLYLVRRIGEVDVLATVQEKAISRIFLPGIQIDKGTGKQKPLEQILIDTFTTIEELYMKPVEQALGQIPVVQDVFEHIYGCGPLITAIVVSNTRDIRFYPTEGKYKAYAGYRNMEDGSRQHRIAGETANWNHDLKQGAWLFAYLIRTKGQAHWPFRQCYDLRKPYEAAKLAMQLAIVLAQLKDSTAGLSEEEILKDCRHLILVDDLEDNKKKDSTKTLVLKAQLRSVRRRNLDELRASNVNWRPCYQQCLDLVTSNQPKQTLMPRVHEKTMRYIAQKYLVFIHQRWTVFNAGGEYRDFEPNEAWMAEFRTQEPKKEGAKK